MFLAGQGVLVADAKNALHLGAAVQIRIESLIGPLLLGAEIHAAGKFADADEIGTAHKLILKR